MRNAEVIRQWQVLREIEARRTGVTIHELAALAHVSTRTIRRDLEALQESGFAIFDEGEANDTKRWRLEGSPFRDVQEGLTVADVAALYLSRSLVEGVSGWPLGDELRGAFAKIEAALNPRMKAFLSTLPDVIATKAGPRARRDLAAVDITRRLFDAVRDRRKIEMRYFSAASGTQRSYRLEPYQLALAHGGLYLVGWVDQYQEFRTFAVERIQRLSVTEEPFKRTRDLPKVPFGQSMGVFSGDPERVVVEFEPRAAMIVRARVWHESQQLEDLPQGRLRMTLAVTNDWALRGWLLGFGASVKVLIPPELAEAIASECRAIVEQYASESTATRSPDAPAPGPSRGSRRAAPL